VAKSVVKAPNQSLRPSRLAPGTN